MFQLILIGILLIPCVGIAWHPRGDLNVYYSVSRYILNGNVARIYSENQTLGNFFYGPLGLAFLKPLALMSYASAHWFWVGLNLTGYLFFWKYFFRLFPVLFEKRARWFFLIVWIASIKPIHASFQSFNIQLMCAALLFAAECWTLSPKRNRQILAGLTVTWLVAIKVFPLFILVYYVFTKSKNVWVGGVIGLITALLIPVGVFGFPLGITLTKEFVLNLFSYHNAYPLADGTYLLSLPSLMAWFGKVMGAPTAADFASKILIIGLSALFFLSCYRDRQKEQIGYWALGMALMTLLNSVSRVDYFIFYLPAFAVLAQYRVEHTQMRRWFTVSLVTSLFLICGINEWTLGSNELNHRLEGYRVPVYGMILLCLLLVGVIRNQRAALVKSQK